MKPHYLLTLVITTLLVVVIYFLNFNSGAYQANVLQTFQVTSFSEDKNHSLAQEGIVVEPRIEL